MALSKNTLPILDYDDNPQAVIMPDHEKLCRLPEYAAFPFLGEQVESFAREQQLTQISAFDCITKTFPIYQLDYCGKSIALCQAPLGSAAAVMILDFLIGYGVKNIISAGSCGALIPLEENQFLIPTEALRDEGASYHYLPPAPSVKANEKAVHAIEKAMEKHNIPYLHGKTWSTDGFFRETKEVVEQRRAQGCSVVEMECAGLMACAQFRGVTFGQLLFTADSLANVEQHEVRNWGNASMPLALQLCLDALVEL